MLIWKPSRNISIALVFNIWVEEFFTAFLKTFHHSPRPFWVYNNITPDVCQVEFGNPSGHSQDASYFAMYVFFYWILNKGQKTVRLLEEDQLPLAEENALNNSQGSSDEDEEFNAKRMKVFVKKVR